MPGIGAGYINLSSKIVVQAGVIFINNEGFPLSMKEYYVHYPGWFVLAQLGFLAVFAAVFTHISIQREIWLFTAVGFAFFAFAGVLLLYVLKTGRYPVSLRAK